MFTYFQHISQGLNQINALPAFFEVRVNLSIQLPDYKSFVRLCTIISTTSQTSQIGLTESVKGDARRFEIWLQGRAEVHTIQASSIDVKQTWVRQIKAVLMSQLAELKGKQNTALLGKTGHKYGSGSLTKFLHLFAVTNISFDTILLNIKRRKKLQFG